MPPPTEPPEARTAAAGRARRGRPRMYANAAEKQRVYRQRRQRKLDALAALPQAEQLLRAADPDQSKPKTGRELLAALTANGFIGAWKDRDDIGDSVEFARQLRERAWSRERD